MAEKLHSQIRLIIADDHELYRDGLKTLLEKNKSLQIVGEAANGKELIEVCENVQTDIVLTDIEMPVMDGIDATSYIYSHFPSIKIIALSMFNQDNLIIDMIQAGALGYLIKNANKHEIVEAINSVYKDIPYYCRSTSMKLAKLIGTTGFGGKALEKISFTEKELGIIKLLCEEKTSKEIADIIFVSPRTVDEYRERIREKMKVKGTTGIVVYALQNELVKLERK